MATPPKIDRRALSPAAAPVGFKGKDTPRFLPAHIMQTIRCAITDRYVSEPGHLRPRAKHLWESHTATTPTWFTISDVADSSADPSLIRIVKEAAGEPAALTCSQHSGRHDPVWTHYSPGKGTHAIWRREPMEGGTALRWYPRTSAAGHPRDRYLALSDDGTTLISSTIPYAWKLTEHD